MDRKRTVLAALLVATALVAVSGGLAFASSAFSTPPADRVGTFESTSAHSDATPFAPSTARTTRQSTPAARVVVPHGVEPEPVATTAPGAATSAPVAAPSQWRADERESPGREPAEHEPRDD